MSALEIAREVITDGRSIITLDSQDHAELDMVVGASEAQIVLRCVEILHEAMVQVRSELRAAS